MPIPVGGHTYALQAIAQKRGVQVFECAPGPDAGIPDRITRQKLDREVTKAAHEHLIIFADAARRRQTWQWVAREPGKPAALREHNYVSGQAADALIQKLDHLRIPISEEDAITVTGAALKLKDAFDKDRVTKRFYDRFKSEHQVFLSFISGIREVADKEWYASLMLNRLMFIYFIQKKGFLDGDLDYLKNRLRRVHAGRGAGSFLSFYRYFLKRLFHEGLAAAESERSAELDALLGRVPYLNGGLFDVHQLEEQNPGIDIPDEAFEKLFTFFDAYQWHLDDRPLSAGNEINPDVLGYIFEKYINQKQMGAYYTKEDITEYIAKNTVVPFLLDAAAKDCAIAFRPGAGSVWSLLQDDPDRYIYPSVLHGVGEALPDDIAAGTADVSRRGGWNRSAPAPFALPTETWREHVARRQRCIELRAKLSGGEVASVNDLVTLNLNIRQFIQDAIERCEGPELLRAFFKAIEKVTVLDPTCGSGAFLFAALNILQPLYEACLERMEAFLEDLERAEPDHDRRKFSDFRRVLDNVAKHPSRDYFVLKSIILNNLYGVDIMEEAVEICKLRLFLKLVAQVETYDQIEPLPDIDFNIRAGNTLVGFATYEEATRAFKFDLDGVLPRVKEAAENAARAFERFHEMQTEHGMDAAQFREAKATVRVRLDDLGSQLDRHLAGQHGIDPNDAISFRKWRMSHEPFHWFVDFYDIIAAGGFDICIGNPPYVELKEIKYLDVGRYDTQATGNLYALFVERGLSIGLPRGRQGFIVPVSSVSTDRYHDLQEAVRSRLLHFSSFDDRPSRLFEGLEHVRLTIHLLSWRDTQAPWLFSSRYHKWNSTERSVLFENLAYVESNADLLDGSFPKLSDACEKSILAKLFGQKKTLRSSYARRGVSKIYYSRKVGYFLQAINFIPRVLDGSGRLRPPSEFKDLELASQDEAAAALCCLNSSLFYWFITAFSDCRHVNKREVDAFPVDLADLVAARGDSLTRLSQDLMLDLRANSEERTMTFSHDTLTVQCLYPKRSKRILDEIDHEIAELYDLSDFEGDFIANYDIKYRLGADDREA